MSAYLDQAMINPEFFFQWSISDLSVQQTRREFPALAMSVLCHPQAPRNSVPLPSNHSEWLDEFQCLPNHRCSPRPSSTKGLPRVRADLPGILHNHSFGYSLPFHTGKPLAAGPQCVKWGYPTQDAFAWIHIKLITIVLRSGLPHASQVPMATH